VVIETAQSQFLVGTTPGNDTIAFTPSPSLRTVQARQPVEFAGHSMRVTNSTGAHLPIQIVAEINKSKKKKLYL
jgi:hypothetical protein